MFKKLYYIFAVIVLISCASIVTNKGHVVMAQSLPYNLTVAWNPSVDAVTYNCYLDGARVATGVTSTTCSFPVTALGSHTVGVTAVNTTFVPSESTPGTLTFTLKSPNAPTALNVK